MMTLAVKPAKGTPWGGRGSDGLLLRGGTDLDQLTSRSLLAERPPWWYEPARQANGRMHRSTRRDHEDRPSFVPQQAGHLGGGHHRERGKVAPEGCDRSLIFSLRGHSQGSPSTVCQRVSPKRPSVGEDHIRCPRLACEHDSTVSVSALARNSLAPSKSGRGGREPENRNLSEGPRG